MVNGNFSGLSLDIRSHAGDSMSSIIVSIKPFKDNGTSSVVVENEDLEGKEATLVVLDNTGTIVIQVSIIIGGEKNV